MPDLVLCKAAAHNPKFAFNTRFDNSLLIPAERIKPLHRLTVEHPPLRLMMKTNCFDVPPNLKTDDCGVKRLQTG